MVFSQSIIFLSFWYSLYACCVTRLCNHFLVSSKIFSICLLEKKVSEPGQASLRVQLLNGSSPFQLLVFFQGALFKLLWCGELVLWSCEIRSSYQRAIIILRWENYSYKGLSLASLPTLPFSCLETEHGLLIDGKF